MAILYDKDGKPVHVPYSVDVKGWVEDGYSPEKPQPKKRAPRKKVEK